MPIIGVSAEAKSGKDTFCRFLKEELEKRRHRVEIRGFADALKEGIGKHIMGFTDEQLWGDKKEEIDEYWNVSPRFVLQAAGEGLRELIHPRLWVLSPNGPIQRHFEYPDRIILVNDVRYPNEAETIQIHNGFIVKIRRPNKASIRNGIDNHSSETQVKNLPHDYLVVNDMTLEELQEEATSVVKTAERRWQAHNLI